MKEIEVTLTYVPNELYNLDDLQRHLVDYYDDSIAIISEESVNPATDMTVLIKQVLEVGPEVAEYPNNQFDQHGINHGPYLPLKDADLDTRLMHQLNEHSKTLGGAWGRGLISNMSAFAIDKNIKSAKDKLTVSTVQVPHKHVFN